MVTEHMRRYVERKIMYTFTDEAILAMAAYLTEGEAKKIGERADKQCIARGRYTEDEIKVLVQAACNLRYSR